MHGLHALVLHKEIDNLLIDNGTDICEEPQRITILGGTVEIDNRPDVCEERQ